jgi:predicted metal-dependent peptidase
VSGSFTGFQAKPSASLPRHSILCLDVSGSMSDDYPQLAKGANDYITIQRGRGGIISIVQFDKTARILYERNTRNIGEKEGFTNGGTDFTTALQLALQVVGRNPSGYECRILFFTDGQAGIPTTELQTLRTKGIRMDVVGYGSVNESVLNQLVTGGEVTIGRTINDVQNVFRAIAAAD